MFNYQETQKKSDTVIWSIECLIPNNHPLKLGLYIFQHPLYNGKAHFRLIKLTDVSIIHYY